MKKLTLQTMLDELHDESTMDEIPDQDLEFISGGEEKDPSECTDYTHCGSFKS
ncbi:hypothetical protein HA051_05880 [Chromobacterium vaccinii]|nr:hypothetical protein [Chromobacterium vaccinii]